jgi:hypothetical protein
MREGCKSSGAAARGNFRPGSAGAGKGVNLIGGARLTERRGGGGRLGKALSERENVFAAKTRLTCGLDGPAGTVSACGEQCDQWAGWARGRTCRGVGRAKNQEKRNF